jgi:hypothetical protein
MWQRQSSPQPGGEVQSYMTHDSIRAHIGQEARFRAIGHMTEPEPISAGR